MNIPSSYETQVIKDKAMSDCRDTISEKQALRAKSNTESHIKDFDHQINNLQNEQNKINLIPVINNLDGDYSNFVVILLITALILILTGNLALVLIIIFILLCIAVLESISK